MIFRTGARFRPAMCSKAHGSARSAPVADALAGRPPLHRTCAAYRGPARTSASLPIVNPLCRCVVVTLLSSRVTVRFFHCYASNVPVPVPVSWYGLARARCIARSPSSVVVIPLGETGARDTSRMPPPRVGETQASGRKKSRRALRRRLSPHLPAAARSPRRVPQTNSISTSPSPSIWPRRMPGLSIRCAPT